MNSVQTIMASTGESVDVVNGYLDQLNDYADKTIYSFSDMTQNIGKFTNAGVKLEDAVKAIQGVSNEAAVSGANANEASRAMYNFAQALSAGYVKLIDWKSIENANMATVEFKNSLLDTAVALGTVTKQGDEYITTTTNNKGETSEAFNATKNFNEALQYQWMTTEVLTQTLQNYSTDIRELTDAEKQEYEAKLRGLGYSEEQIQAIEKLGMKAADAAKDVKTFSQLIDTLKESLGSSWTRSWQLVIGDLEEAKKLWTKINDILSGYISASAKARNATIEAWVKAGGRTAAINGLISSFKRVTEVLEAVKKGFSNVFPAKSGEEIAAMFKRFAEFAKSVKKSEEQLNAITKKTELFLRPLKKTTDAIGNFGRIALDIFKAVSEGLHFDITWVTIIQDFANRFYELSEALKPAKQLLTYIQIIVRNFVDLLSEVGKGIAKFGLEIYDNFIGGLKDLLPEGKNVITWLADLSKWLHKTTTQIKEFFDGLNQNTGATASVASKVSSIFLIIGESIVKIGKIGIDVFKRIASGISEALDSRWVDIISGLVRRFRQLVEILTPSEKMLYSIYRIFHGLTSIVQSVVTVIYRLGAALFDKLIGPLRLSEDRFDGVAKVIRLVGRYLDHLSKKLEETFTYSYFATIINDISTAIKNFIDSIKNITGFDQLVENFEEFFKTTKDNSDSPTLIERLADALKKFSDKIKELSDRLNNFTFDLAQKLKLDELGPKIANFFGGIWKLFSSLDVIKLASDLIGKLGESFGQLISKFDPSKINPMDILNTLLNIELFKKLYGIFNKIDTKLSETIPETKSLLDKFKDTVSEVTKTITGSFKTIAKELTETLQSIQNNLNASALLKIAVSIAILVGALYFLSTMDTENIVPALAALTILFGELGAALYAIQKFDIGAIAKNMNLNNVASALLRISASVLILALALKSLAKLEPQQLSQGLLAISMLLGEMIAVVKVLSKGNGDLVAGAGALIKFAAAVLIITSAVKSLAKVRPDRLMPAMLALTAIIAELGVLTWALSDITRVSDPWILTEVSKGLLIFVAAVRVLVGAVKSLGQLEPDQLIAGCVAVGVLMGSLVVAAIALTDKQFVDLPYQLMELSKALIVFVAAIKILSTIVLKFAELNPDQLIQGVVGMGAVMAALVVAAIALCDKDFINSPYMLKEVSKSLLIFVAVVKILSTVVTDFAALEVDKLVQGMIGLGAVVAIIVLAAGKLSGMNLKGLNEAALGMMAFVGCVKTLSDAAIKMSAIPFDQLVTGLGGLIVITALLVGVSEILSKEPLEPTKIAAVSASLILFGVAVGVMALSIVALGNLGLPGLAIGVIGIALAIGLFAGAAVLLTPVIPQMALLATVMMEFGLALALVGAGVGIAAAGIALLVGDVAAGGFTCIEVLRQLIGLLPELAGKFAEAIARFLTVIGENGPQIQEGLRQLFEIIVLAIAENGMLIINVVLEFITQFLESLAEYVPRMAEAGLAIIDGLLTAIANHMGSITDAACTIVIEFIRGITEKLPEIINTAFKMVIAFINGLADAIRENHDALWDAIGNLISAIAEAIIDGYDKIANAIADLLAEGLKAIDQGLNDFFDAGANLVKGFIDGIKSLGTEIWNAGCNLVDTAWKAITGAAQEHSPSKLTFGGGVNFVLGFINGMKDQFGATSQTAKQLVYGAWSAIQDGLSSDMDFAPTVTPVMDLSNIQNGIVTAKDLIYSMPNTYGISASIANDKDLKRQMVDLMASQGDYTDILKGMGQLKDELASYGDKLSQMQVVLDTGTMVGVMSSPMDQALGVRQVLAGRGVL